MSAGQPTNPGSTHPRPPNPHRQPPPAPHRALTVALAHPPAGRAVPWEAAAHGVISPGERPELFIQLSDKPGTDTPELLTHEPARHSRSLLPPANRTWRPKR
ncbi:hypothetical protein GCM10029964_106860 [Kibdelosporangium lantanae]